MQKLIEKLVEIEKKLSRSKGSFELFALFLREDAHDKWDLVIASDWARENKRLATNEVVKQINEVLGKDEILKLSRVVILDKENDALKALHSAMQVEHSIAELSDCNFFGLSIKRGYLITSKRKI